MMHGPAKAAPVIRYAVTCSVCGTTTHAATDRDKAEENAADHNTTFHPTPTSTKKESTR